MAALTASLPDGRRLGYAHYGARHGTTFFYFHGLPGSRREARLLHAAAEARGIRVVAVDRPGYGRSDPLPGRSLYDWPDDVAALADALGLARFGVIGVSGGGPYALACAHALPERVIVTGVVCGLGPVAEPALRRAMRWPARLVFALAAIYPPLLNALAGTPLAQLAHRRPASLLRLAARFNGGPDREVLLREDVLGILSDSLREAFLQGPAGAVQDTLLYRRPWGFDPGAITGRVIFWHGEADRIVPCLHSAYLQARMRQPERILVPDEGHFSLPIRHAPAILSRLASNT